MFGLNGALSGGRILGLWLAPFPWLHAAGVRLLDRTFVAEPLGLEIHILRRFFKSSSLDLACQNDTNNMNLLTLSQNLPLAAVFCHCSILVKKTR